MDKLISLRTHWWRVNFTPSELLLIWHLFPDSRLIADTHLYDRLPLFPALGFSLIPHAPRPSLPRW